MKISLNMFRASVVSCVALLANAAFAIPTSSLTIDFNEVGSDVVATVAGSVDISSLIPQASGTMTMRNFVAPNDGLAGFSDSGSPVAFVSWRIDEQAAYAAPFWGDGSNAGNVPRFATSTTGSGSFYLEGNPLSSPETNEARIRFPATYAGEAMNGTMTWAGQTYASMGLATSGTWNWQTAAGGTVALRINAVPEPTGCVGMAFAAVALGVWIRRRAPKA